MTTEKIYRESIKPLAPPERFSLGTLLFREIPPQSVVDIRDAWKIVSPTSPLEAGDFQQLAGEVDPYIEENGFLKRLLLEAKSFPGWHDFGGLVSHFRFVRDHHAKIKKLAAVSDSELLTIIPRIASHFVCAEIRHIASVDKQQAIDWLKAP